MDLKTTKKVAVGVFVASSITALIVQSKTEEGSNLRRIKYPLIALALFSGLFIVAPSLFGGEK